MLYCIVFTEPHHHFSRNFHNFTFGKITPLAIAAKTA